MVIMIFTETQIENILREIEFQHLFFLAQNVSVDVLTEKDKEILSAFGVDWETLRQDFTPYEQSFYFGRLAAVLGPLQSQKVEYTDLMKYLRQGQFVPLSRYEKATLAYLQTKTYSYIKDLGFRVGTYITQSMRDTSFARRQYYESVINDALKRAVVERDTASSVMREIGEKTGDWTRDLGRIAETEMQNAFEMGKATALRKDFDDDDKVYYKEVYAGACRHCIRLYTTGGIGSEPRLFSYNELLANGTNMGRKSADWLPVLGTVHPFCFADNKTPIYTSKGYKAIEDIQVGDLVLTSRARFRRVTDLIFTERSAENFGVYNIDVRVGEKVLRLKKITGEHPIFVNGQWKNASEVVVGDRVSVLTDACEDESCDGRVPVVYKWRSTEAPPTRFCCRNCANRYTATVQWQNPQNREIVSKKVSAWNKKRMGGLSLEERRAFTEKARKVCDTKYPNFSSPFFSEETKRKANSANGKKGTFIERKLRYFLDKLGVEYVTDFSIKRNCKDSMGRARFYRPDIYIPSLNIIFEADGEAWHDKEKDSLRDKEIRELIGADIFRFSESEIRTNGKFVFEEMERILKNHRGIYGFGDGVVVNVEFRPYKDKDRTVKLYNFAVEEDESYVANGILVHNCRCDLRVKRKPTHVWDKKRGIFGPPEVGDVKGKIEITVGDKKFFV